MRRRASFVQRRCQASRRTHQRQPALCAHLGDNARHEPRLARASLTLDKEQQSLLLLESPNDCIEHCLLLSGWRCLLSNPSALFFSVETKPLPAQFTCQIEGFWQSVVDP